MTVGTVTAAAAQGPEYDTEIVAGEATAGEDQGAPFRFISAAELILDTGSPTLGVVQQCPVWVLPAGSTVAVRFGVAIPADWSTFKATVLFVPGAANGNAGLTFTSGSFVAGGAVAAGVAATPVAVPVGASTTTVVSADIATGLAVAGPIVWGRVTRTTGGIDTATGSVQLIGVLLSKVFPTIAAGPTGLEAGVTY